MLSFQLLVNNLLYKRYPYRIYPSVQVFYLPANEYYRQLVQKLWHISEYYPTGTSNSGFSLYTSKDGLRCYHFPTGTSNTQQLDQQFRTYSVYNFASWSSESIKIGVVNSLSLRMNSHLKSTQFWWKYWWNCLIPQGFWCLTFI